MGESELIVDFRSEADLIDFAGNLARRLLADRRYPLMIGLRGDLGAGKTTWARAMLRGIGYTARVPSPTYTLLEHYRIGDLSVVHLDLYRLANESELENLGLRDWLEQPRSWMLIEWPERAPQLAAHCDLVVDLADRGWEARRLTIQARTPAGFEALENSRDGRVNNER